MKQFLQKLLMLTAILLPCIQSYAHGFEVDGIYYVKTSDNTVAVSFQGEDFDSYSNEYNGSVEIPESVVYSGVSYSVTSIGFSAFRGCSSMSMVSIPGSVTYINSSAFEDCTGLVSVTIPNSVISIGSSAFYGCKGLKKCCYPSGLSNPFNYGISIEYCREGSRIVDGIVLSDECIYFVPMDFKGECIIPESVTKIGDYAFYFCDYLTSVSMPDHLLSIGNYAFVACDDLTSVAIPGSVTSIGSCAFDNCVSLTSLAIPESVTSIGKEAFYGCSSLTSVTIPNSITTIPDGAFFACWNLTVLTLPDSVTVIGNDAFAGCDGLTSVVIPGSVSVISDGAFYGCDGLTSIKIPGSVNHIGNMAFNDCPCLESVTVEALTPPAANKDTFSSTTYSNATLIVPEESESLFRTAECWKEFSNISAGIGAVNTDGLTETGRYNTAGQAVDPTYRGVVIIRCSDGSVRKMMAR